MKCSESPGWWGTRRWDPSPACTRHRASSLSYRSPRRILGSYGEQLYSARTLSDPERCDERPAGRREGERWTEWWVKINTFLKNLWEPLEFHKLFALLHNLFIYILNKNFNYLITFVHSQSYGSMFPQRGKKKVNVIFYLTI